MRFITATSLVGRQVVDTDGTWIGEVKDTWPLDGGGHPELVLVKLGRRFARLRYLPVETAQMLELNMLRVPFTRHEIDDAPDAEDRRWGDPAHVARGHWTTAGD